MEMGENDNFEQGNRTEEEDPMNYSSSISSAWQFNNGSINLTNSSSMGLVRNEDLVVCSSYSCTSLVDPTTTLWDQPTNIQNSGFRSVNIPENLIMKGGVFLPNMHRMPPPSLSQFPANSAFIERATRFPCFSDIATTPFNLPEPVALCPRGVGPVHGPHEAYPNNGLRLSIEQNIGEASKDVSMEVEASEKSPIKNDRRSESPVRSQDELKQGIVGGSSNGSDGAEFSGGGGGAGQDESHMLEDTIVGGPSHKGLGSKKSKRGGQNSEVDQARDSPCQKGESVKDEMEIQKKEARTPSSTTNRATGKHFKQGSPASDPPKQEYIHVRARRGQATNSHSLAERVRREKISERMKFLQDLVPGCSKVTGKAVMLDEIINYVQSLQRQVEFLSMKLATVNPWLDFNIEDLLTKDILQSRAAPSSTMAFTPEMHMPYPSLHQSPHGLIPSGLPCMGSASDILRRTINSQLMTPTTGPGFKEPTQLPNVWEDELHNAFQSFGTPAQSNSQDVDGTG